MSTILLGVAAFVVMIVVVVGVHEAGHFTTAKWSGIRVDEFAVGFGPRLWSRRRGETVYSLRALPLGGFVKMPGMSALEEDDGGARGFMHAPVGRQLLVLVAGVTMNLLLAGLLFGVGRTETVAAGAAAHLPAAAAGLGPGDHLVAVGDRRVDPQDTQAVQDALHEATDSGRGAPLRVAFRRAGGSEGTATITPALAVIDQDDTQQLVQGDGQRTVFVVVDSVDGGPVGTGDPARILGGGGGGVSITGHTFGADRSDPAARVRATLHGVHTGRGGLGTVQAAWYVGYSPGRAGESLPVALGRGFTSLPSEVVGRVRDIWDVLTTPNSGGVKNFQGPVGIAHDASLAADSGWYSYISLVALISLSLGIINVIPIPPFDGGRVVLVLGQALRRKGSGARVELAFITAGALLIGALAVLITLNDIRGI